MARKKKPENETEDAAYQRQILEYISNVASRSEKTSWNRKLDNMVKLIAQLTPIQERILDIEKEKQPLIDEINQLRSMMVHECVHPYEQLVLKDDHILCKFCNRRIGLPNVDETT